MRAFPFTYSITFFPHPMPLTLIFNTRNVMESQWGIRARGSKNEREKFTQKHCQTLQKFDKFRRGSSSLSCSLSPLSWREKKLSEFQTFKVAVKLRKQAGGTKFIQIPTGHRNGHACYYKVFHKWLFSSSEEVTWVEEALYGIWCLLL